MKDSLCLEPYLSSEDSVARRFTAIKSRSADILRVESGRREQLPRQGRTCLVCGIDETEDPGHFLLRCSAYRQIREELLSFIES
jgi:hypothetical protein